jgi:hypothetical protein
VSGFVATDTFAQRPSAAQYLGIVGGIVLVVCALLVLVPRSRAAS